MNRSRIVMASCALVTIICTTIASLRWRETPLGSRAIEIPDVAPAPDPATTDESLTAAEIDVVAAHDPFRLANTPSRVAFDATGADNGPAFAPAPRPIPPNLVLKAIVGGPPWQAIVDGLPGQSSGVIATAGAVFQDLVIRSVTRDRVVVEGRDTAWVLTFGGAP